MSIKPTTNLPCCGMPMLEAVPLHGAEPVARGGILPPDAWLMCFDCGALLVRDDTGAPRCCDEHEVRQIPIDVLRDMRRARNQARRLLGLNP